MSAHRSPAARLGAAALGATLLLTACGNDGGGGDDGDGGSEGGEPLPEPEYDSDESVRLPMGLVTPAGHAENTPIDDDGHMEIEDDSENVQMIESARSDVFGCEDTISVITTVPTVTEDPTSGALGYLIADEEPTHGEPEFINLLTEFEDLSLESAELDDDVVTVELTGEAPPVDACAGARIHAQIEATARAASGAAEAELLLDGEPLSEALGIEEPDPLELTQITSRD
ncbi:MAG: GerMN domain-containing protein [Nesterenkonia sp.]|uniref:GerMN domain-containing protein n=1 Tax=Nesterenkonia marinintestina TaxID=2979865 RepID=UPI0021BE1181|nr:GerMN domain-containing protein [Nesterenkonia sp. GX14115]MDO5492970.1 GerMN domain-containing protein [Nesterenkonia sp.]